MRVLYAAGITIMAAAAALAGISAGEQLQQLFLQTQQKPAATIQPAQAAPAPAEHQRPSPIIIEMADGTCVEPEYRNTWTISKGETAGDIALATLNGVEEWLDKAYKILSLNEAGEYALPLGQKLLTFNGWQKPRIILPEKPIVLEPGQLFFIRPGLEGLLCDSAHLELQENDKWNYIGDFSPDTKTFNFVPKPEDAGNHKLHFRGGDDDITTYGAASYRALAKSPSVLRVEGTVEIQIKAKP